MNNATAAVTAPKTKVTFVVGLFGQFWRPSTTPNDLTPALKNADKWNSIQEMFSVIAKHGYWFLTAGSRLYKITTTTVEERKTVIELLEGSCKLPEGAQNVRYAFRSQYDDCYFAANPNESRGFWHRTHREGEPSRLEGKSIVSALSDLQKLIGSYGPATVTPVRIYDLITSSETETVEVLS